MKFYLYLILFFTVFLSGSSVFFWKKENKFFSKLVLSFSGAYLFTLSILHLIPEVFEQVENSTKIGGFILLGFLLQLLLEFFTEGIEHGHVHTHKEKNFPIAIIVGLFLHSVLEGMPLNSNIENHNHNSLLLGIIIHNIPISFAFVTMLKKSHVSSIKIFVLLFLFALTAPFGATIIQVFNSQTLGSITPFYPYIMALVIGIFLHISTTILFESSENHKFNAAKLAVIVFGGMVAYLTIG